MITRRRAKSLSGTLAKLFVAVLIGNVTAERARAQGTTSNPGPIQFPTLGVGPGQTLRLNAVASQPGPIGSPAAGCVAILSFSDPAGNVMVQPGPIGINLLPGQAAFLDLPSGNLRRGQRLEARPTVEFPASGGGTDCTFGTEIFDAITGFGELYGNDLVAQLGSPFYSMM